MRWELAYLIAAEAACRDNSLTDAQNYLFSITDNRVVTGQETAYNTWKSALTDQASLLAAIKYNWHVELWGEGYGLQTFRRYGESVVLGANHRRSNKNISPTQARVFTFELPSSELYYNPYIRTTDVSSLQKKH
ncbi:MAG: RagB/SusD family nutrient uptake outer membrane protein [Paludibacteraceae bacterium]|nr:RagB/SusD family nutrient uptake outer membrane protein [Paludibacteraceae bacterium]